MRGNSQQRHIFKSCSYALFFIFVILCGFYFGFSCFSFTDSSIQAEYFCSSFGLSIIAFEICVLIIFLFLSGWLSFVFGITTVFIKCFLLSILLRVFSCCELSISYFILLVSFDVIIISLFLTFLMDRAVLSA